MIKTRYRDIKQDAKFRVNDRFGDALLIVLIPTLIVYAISMMTGALTAFLPIVTGVVVDRLISFALRIISSLVITTMIVRFARGRDGFSFDGIFNNKNKVLQFAIYSVIAGILSALPLLPLLDMFKELLPTFITTQDTPTLESVTRVYVENNPELINNMFQALGLAILVALIQVKFIFTAYLIVDKNMKAIEAFKESWRLTNGNYFRILFFPLIFFFWYLLIIVTCGLAAIYVIPLTAVAQVFLYIVIVEEKDYEYGEDNPRVTTVTPVAGFDFDPLDYEE